MPKPGISIVKDQYKNIAKWYDLIIEPQVKALKKIAFNMFPPDPAMNVLDIGCGTGSTLKLYQEENCNIFGIDLSPAMLNIAMVKLESRANLQLVDASNTDFPNDKFDLILSSTVLHEIDPQVRMNILKEAKRILSNNGRLLLIDFHPGPIKGIKGVYSKILITIAEILAGKVHYKNYRQFIQSGGLPSLIGSTGYVIEDKKIVGGGTFGVFLLKPGE